MARISSRIRPNNRCGFVTRLTLKPAENLTPDANWALFLDVDGTLLHIAETPNGVSREEDVCRLLTRLQAALRGAVALISGREIRDLDRLFAPLELPSAGLHGLEHRDAQGHLNVLGEAETLDYLRAPLRKMAGSHAGLMLEDKGRALAFHYRLAPGEGRRIEQEISDLVADSPDLKLIHGKMVVEIKPRHADKGSALRAFMTEPPFSGRIPVFLGDDVTDEDAFEAVNDLGGVSIHIGQDPGAEHETGQTAASYRIQDVDGVVRWLTGIAAGFETVMGEHNS